MPTRLDEDTLRAVTELAQQLAANDGVRSVVLVGSATGERWTPGRSDINLAVVLKDTSEPSLHAIGTLLRHGWRRWRCAPWLVTAAELPHLSDVWAVKLLDLRYRRRVLAGPDVFADLTLDDEALRLGVERELRNLQVRLRRARAFAATDSTDLPHLLSITARALAVPLRALLHVLDGPEAPLAAEPLTDAAERFELPILLAADAWAGERVAPEAADAPALAVALDQLVIIADRGRA